MKKQRNLFIILFLLLLLAGSLMKSTTLAEGIREGLSLCYQSVLPALFPSMILCGMIGECAEYLPLPPTITLWITSQLCGFPLGIRTLTRGYRRGLISRDQAIRLSACCSNASPAFLTSYIGKGLFGSFQLGLSLWISQIIVSLLLGISLNAFTGKPFKSNNTHALLPLITQSFAAAASGGLNLVAYITAFAAIGSLLQPLPGFCWFYGFIELTGGLTFLPDGHFLMAAAMVGFSGWSVMLQNGAYLAEHELPLWPMLLGKSIYMLFLPVVSIIFQKSRFLFIILPFLLIIFDKIRKKGYNKKQRCLRGEKNDLFQRN